MTHGDNFVLAGPTERLTYFENKMTGCNPIKAKLIIYGSSESIKAFNRRLHWRKGEDWCLSTIPRHADVLVKDLGLEHGCSVQTPTVHDVTRDEEPKPL